MFTAPLFLPLTPLPLFELNPPPTLYSSPLAMVAAPPSNDLRRKDRIVR